MEIEEGEENHSFERPARANEHFFVQLPAASVRMKVHAYICMFLQFQTGGPRVSSLRRSRTEPAGPGQ